MELCLVMWSTCMREYILFPTIVLTILLLALYLLNTCIDSTHVNEYKY